MNKFKRVESVFFLIVFILLSISVAHAESVTKIIITPFSIDAENPNSEIAQKIPLMISDLLKNEGAQVSTVKNLNESVEKWSPNQFSRLGIQAGADYILTGSIFIAGDSISIDSNLINTFDPSDQKTFYSQAVALENLYSAVSKISKEITSVIFKKKFITGISISGNKRIEKDAILRQIKAQAGDILKAQTVSQDLKNVYAMGYFDDVIVKKQSNDQGISLIFNVVEKATVRRIRFNKNVILEDEDLQELVNTRTGSILNIHKIKDDINRMRLMYTSKNYHNIDIDYEIKPLENSQADIVFTFNEGDKLMVEKITFEGNKHFTEKSIKKAMETEEKGFFSFFTSSGDLDEIEVKNDVIRIESLYKNNGFINAKVSDPIIDIGADSISVHFKIREGQQFKIQSIDIQGDLIQPKEELFELLESKSEDLYNREKIRKDVHLLSDNYFNQGYANVKISPLIDQDQNTNTMRIIYNIKKGKLVYFDRIRIKGNTKTRDKVIRREIKISEQGKYSKEKIEQTYGNLSRLDFFENVEVTPVETNQENVRDLEVTVKEKRTGSFSVGGGFSSEVNGFFTIDLKENNLFGRGQSGSISAEISGEEVLYNISFFEPYIYDSKVSGGINLYKQEKEYDHYDKDSVGFNFNIGYKLFDYTRIGIRYAIEDFDIRNVDTENTTMTEGSFLSSSLTPFIRYDSRNAAFMPSKGSKHELSVEYSGNFLGGDIDFVKYRVSSTFYFPLIGKFVGAIHGEGGYIHDQSDEYPNIDYEKFYLGGMNSIRGFESSDINGRRGDETRDRGGEKYVLMNLELSYPLSEEYRISGVLFYDRGDVYRESEDIDFADQFSSTGFGVRWNSPFGPVRVDYGWVIEGKDVRDNGSSKVSFAVGASF